ncbi:hypothetical protein UABAM_04543 [Candidatus Uabimicrobium amorphum]|uniref:Membrane protein insertion efficiency factor YidD n=1 Tax=Uabimicrobium amorphum TaxID=2596890 RepID=A0A5S9IR23_UABAM|nr:membrane protein insertion efficiency factor YidD [Candidatus Uabimicrobium amorphum]BBM86157.1 hypothetical protein UABAM_04543 [Candidatus Uabimicrobium amorphum]
MKILAIQAINFYQRFISPYKGFCCAHKVHHKQESCSQYIKRQILEKGLWNSLRLAGLRFRECKEASIVLNSSIENQKYEQPRKQEKANGYRVKNRLTTSNCNTTSLACETADCCFIASMFRFF